MTTRIEELASPGHATESECRCACCGARVDFQTGTWCGEQLCFRCFDAWSISPEAFAIFAAMAEAMGVWRETGVKPANYPGAAEHERRFREWLKAARKAAA